MGSVKINNNTDISHWLSSDKSFWLVWIWIFPLMYCVMIILEFYAMLSRRALCLKKFFGPVVLFYDFVQGPKVENNDSNNDNQEVNAETEGNPMIVIANATVDQTSNENDDQDNLS